MSAVNGVMAVIDVETRETWRSVGGGMSTERSELTLEYDGEDPYQVRRAAELAITDRLGYLGQVTGYDASEPYPLYGRLVVTVKIDVDKEW